jgi:hypothetical protein
MTLEVTRVREVGGERESTTTTLPTTTLNRNNKKNQHEDSRISIDASRKTPTDRRFVPPLNNILAGFAVAIVPCTTPRSYATPLP